MLGDRSLLQLLWLLCGSELIFKPEQSVFNPKHHLLPLMTVLLTDPLNLELESEHQLAQFSEFLPEAANFSLFSWRSLARKT